MELDIGVLGGNTGAGGWAREDGCWDLVNAVCCILDFDVDPVVCDLLVKVRTLSMIGRLLTCFIDNRQCQIRQVRTVHIASFTSKTQVCSEARGRSLDIGSLVAWARSQWISRRSSQVNRAGDDSRRSEDKPGEDGSHFSKKMSREVPFF